jgi:hypothetical protein
MTRGKKFTGDPCRTCGNTTRYVCDNSCIDCRNASALRWHAKHPDAYRIASAKWRSNPENRAKEKERQAKAFREKKEREQQALRRHAKVDQEIHIFQKSH